LILGGGDLGPKLLQFFEQVAISASWVWVVAEI